MMRLALVVLLTACSACSTPEPPAPAPATPPPAAPAGTSTSGGTVVGNVHASSTAVIVLEPKGTRAFGPQGDKPVMDQVGLQFGPELLLVRTAQPVEFRNSDDTLHNVHVTHEQTREPQFNVAIPTGGAYEYTFARDGFYRVGCDIHPSMAASIFAAKTPYTALAENDGSFRFDDVAAGAWTVTVYTGGKRLQKDVNVKGGVTEVTIE